MASRARLRILQMLTNLALITGAPSIAVVVAVATNAPWAEVGAVALVLTSAAIGLSESWWRGLRRDLDFADADRLTWHDCQCTVRCVVNFQKQADALRAQLAAAEAKIAALLPTTESTNHEEPA